MDFNWNNHRVRVSLLSLVVAFSSMVLTQGAEETTTPSAIGFIHVGASDFQLPSIFLCLKGNDANESQKIWLKDRRKRFIRTIQITENDLKEIGAMLHEHSWKKPGDGSPQGSYIACCWSKDGKTSDYVLPPKEAKAVLERIGKCKIPEIEKKRLESTIQYLFGDKLAPQGEHNKLHE